MGRGSRDERSCERSWEMKGAGEEVGKETKIQMYHVHVPIPTAIAIII